MFQHEPGIIILPSDVNNWFIGLFYFFIEIAITVKKKIKTNTIQISPNLNKLNTHASSCSNGE